MYTNLSNTCVHEHTTPRHTLTHICIHILGTNAHAHLLLVSGLGMRGVMNSSPVLQPSVLSEGNSLGFSMSDWQASDIHFIECLTAVKICVLPMSHGFQNPVIDSTFEDLKAALFWRLSCASLASQAFFQVWVNHSGSCPWNISDCGQPHTLSPYSWPGPASLAGGLCGVGSPLWPLPSFSGMVPKGWWLWGPMDQL